MEHEAVLDGLGAVGATALQHDRTDLEALTARPQELLADRIATGLHPQRLPAVELAAMERQHVNRPKPLGTERLGHHVALLGALTDLQVAPQSRKFVGASRQELVAVGCRLGVVGARRIAGGGQGDEQQHDEPSPTRSERRGGGRWRHGGASWPRDTRSRTP